MKKMICKSTVSILRYKNSMTGGENLRINSRNILAEIINDNSITVNLERGIYNYTIWRSLSRHQPCMWDCPHFTNTYKNKLKQVCANLIPNSYVGNKSLISRLKHMKLHLDPLVICSQKDGKRLYKRKRSVMQQYLK